VRWALDMTSGAAGLLIAVLHAARHAMTYVPGKLVNRMSGAFAGEGKTDAKDARTIAETARLRTDLTVLAPADQLVVELQVLTSRRADLKMVGREPRRHSHPSLTAALSCSALPCPGRGDGWWKINAVVGRSPCRSAGGFAKPLDRSRLDTGMEDPGPTPRMRLRRITAGDVDRVTELHADPEVMRYISGGKPEPREDVAVLIADLVAQNEHGVPGRWLALDRDDGAFLGWFGLRSKGSPAGQREIGYRLHRAVWHKGLATEGSRELVRWGFHTLGLTRIWGTTMAVNTGSRRVMEKAGMSYIRTYHEHFDDPIPGTESGEVEYAITRSDWARLAVDA